MRSPSTLAHFECEPGSTMRRASGIGDSEDFRLLAPHHIRQPGVIDIRKARSERDAPAVGLDLDKKRSDVARPGGTFDVSRLAPAMPTADHARGDDRQRRMGVEPPPDRRLSVPG